MQVNTVKAARKLHTCNRCGGTIAKGAKYYTWQHRQDPKPTNQCVQCGYPKASQLAASDKIRRLTEQQEALEASANEFTSKVTVDSWDDKMSALTEAMGQARDEIASVAGEYMQSADNMEEYFPGGNPKIDEIREKADQCTEWAEYIDRIMGDLEELIIDSYACEYCNGNGTVKCEDCDGSGAAELTKEEAEAGYDTDCSTCGGEGTVDCENCDGLGYDLEAATDDVRGMLDEAMDTEVI